MDLQRLHRLKYVRFLHFDMYFIKHFIIMDQQLSYPKNKQVLNHTPFLHNCKQILNDPKNFHISLK